MLKKPFVHINTVKNNLIKIILIIIVLKFMFKNNKADQLIKFGYKKTDADGEIKYTYNNKSPSEGRQVYVLNNDFNKIRQKLKTN